jgi:hypothetical protein
MNKNNPEMGEPNHMLETLHLAYQYVLGEGCVKRSAVENTRLTIAEQRELGARLANYWHVKSFSTPNHHAEEGK